MLLHIRGSKCFYKEKTTIRLRIKGLHYTDTNTTGKSEWYSILSCKAAGPVRFIRGL
jgi:hypothetical protein